MGISYKTKYEELLVKYHDEIRLRENEIFKLKMQLEREKVSYEDLRKAIEEDVKYETWLDQNAEYMRRYMKSVLMDELIDEFRLEVDTRKCYF